MYRISEFSKITNLTVKALRYYDEQGILVPSHRDSQNGYRYYSEEDFKRAQLVALLRSFEFSISVWCDTSLSSWCPLSFHDDVPPS